jgi:hypothetical protein
MQLGHFIDLTAGVLRAAPGQVRPWCSTGMDDSSPLDSVHASRMPTTEGVGHFRTQTPQQTRAEKRRLRDKVRGASTSRVVPALQHREFNRSLRIACR